MSKMIVSKAIRKARRAGYTRIWLTNEQNTSRLAEFFLEKADSWKNLTVAPFVIREYEGEDVLMTMPHPYQKDTMMISVKFNGDLQSQACDKCLSFLKRVK